MAICSLVRLNLIRKPPLHLAIHNERPRLLYFKALENTILLFLFYKLFGIRTRTNSIRILRSFPRYKSRSKCFKGNIKSTVVLHCCGFSDLRAISDPCIRIRNPSVLRLYINLPPLKMGSTNTT
jgi:hypothetical protein